MFKNYESLVKRVGEKEAYSILLEEIDKALDSQKNLKRGRVFNQRNVNTANVALYFRGLSSFVENGLNRDEEACVEYVNMSLGYILNYVIKETVSEETIIDKNTQDELDWEDLLISCGYAPELAEIVDENTQDDLWYENVELILGYDPSLANDNEGVIKEDKKMDNNINDVSSNIFFFTDRGQMELNKIRVKGVHANEFLVGSITDDAKNLMLEMKPMNHEFNKSDFITMGYLIEEALKSYSRFYEYCQYIYGLGAVEGDFDDFIYQMRLSIELGEITVDEFVA